MTKLEAVFDRLDKLSRARALTENESLMLERVIEAIDSAAPQPKSPRKGAWSTDEDERFLDLIANGESIATAARTVGRSVGAGAGRFRRACDHYGWQAA